MTKCSRLNIILYMAKSCYLIIVVSIHIISFLFSFILTDCPLVLIYYLNLFFIVEHFNVSLTFITKNVQKVYCFYCK